MPFATPWAPFARCPHAPFIELANGFRRAVGGAFSFVIAVGHVTKFPSVTISALFACVPGSGAPVAVVWAVTFLSPSFMRFQTWITGVAHFCSAAVSLALRAGAAVAAAAETVTSARTATVATKRRTRASVAPLFADRPGRYSR